MRLFIVIVCSILSLSATSFLSATEIPAAQPKAIEAAAGNNNDFALALLKKLAKTKESRGKNIFLTAEHMLKIVNRIKEIQAQLGNGR